MMREFLRVTLPVFGVGALAFWWASRHVTPAVRRARWIKFATYLLIVHGVLAAAVLGRTTVVAVIAVIAAIGLMEMLVAARTIARRLAILATSAFGAVAAGAIGFGLTAPAIFVGYVYLVVAAFDGFSQAGGQLAGKRRLAPSVSPGKTIEGFAIGVAGALACAFLLRGAAAIPNAQAAGLAIVASVAGVAGDLAASWLKRRAGIKDYGTLLPGHGGVLDRFDSFLAVAAVLFVLSRID